MVFTSLAQRKFYFKETLEAEAVSRVSSLIKEGEKVKISGIGKSEVNGILEILVFAKNLALFDCSVSLMIFNIAHENPRVKIHLRHV